jgi:hypothetical protein
MIHFSGALNKIYIYIYIYIYIDTHLRTLGFIPGDDELQ